MVNSAFEKISGGLNEALDIARGYPVVTEQMVAFGKAAFFARHLGDMDGNGRQVRPQADACQAGCR